jgi:hypothetical protein
VEGCSGGIPFVGGVFFRMAIKAALTTSASTKAMVQAAIVLPDRGLPAIMASTKMLLSSTAAPGFPSQIIILRRKSAAPHRGMRCLGFRLLLSRRNAGIH